MAKGKNELPPAEDYIDQLQWQANHRRRLPVRFEPKWKFRIIYGDQSRGTGLFGRVFTLLMLASLLFVVITLIPSEINKDNLPGVIFFGGVFLLFALIVFFAVKDGTRKRDNDSDDFDS